MRSASLFRCCFAICFLCLGVPGWALLAILVTNCGVINYQRITLAWMTICDFPWMFWWACNVGGTEIVPPMRSVAQTKTMKKNAAKNASKLASCIFAGPYAQGVIDPVMSLCPMSRLCKELLSAHIYIYIYIYMRATRRTEMAQNKLLLRSFH